MTLTVLRSKVFCRSSLSWDLSNVFLMIAWGLCVWEGRSQRECHFHLLMPRVHDDLSLLSFTLIPLEGDRHVQPTPKERGVTLQLLESEASTSSASIPQLLWALAASCSQLLPLSRKTAPGGPERAHHSPRASHGQWLADTRGQKPHPVTSIQRTTSWDTLYRRGPHGLCQDERPLAHSSFFPSLFCYPYSLVV